MSIACFIRNDSMYEPVLDVLVRHGFHGVRFTDELALGQALAGGVANLVLADVEDASESAIATWRSCRFPEPIPVILLSFVSDDRMMIDALDLSRDLLSLAVWGRSGDIAGRTLEQHVYKPRRKLNLNASRGVQIRVAYNRGYCLEVDEKHQPVAP